MAEGAWFAGTACLLPPTPPLTLPLPFPRIPATPDAPPAGPEDFIQATGDERKRLAAERRRAYNREYMRAWRRRNLEHYRAKNREYQRRTAQRRKLRLIAQAAANAETLCAFACGRPAVTTVERVDPRTWKTSLVPYCGKC